MSSALARVFALPSTDATVALAAHAQFCAFTQIFVHYLSKKTLNERNKRHIFRTVSAFSSLSVLIAAFIARTPASVLEIRNVPPLTDIIHIRIASKG